MDSNIEKLVDKYWATEASLEEELELRRLAKEDASGELDEMKELFGHFDSEKELSLGEDFDEQILSMIDEQEGAKVVRFSDYLKRYSRIAAAVVVVLVSSYFITQQQGNYQETDTFDSPELALAEFKRQMLMVSNYMNAGNESISELSQLGKADVALESLSQMNQASRGMEPLSEMNFKRN